MYDPKFEKAVQRKMEELEFRPSESVWVNIEKAVSGQRRRRVAPFFWRLFIAAMLIGGAATGYYFGEKAGRRSALPAAAQAVITGGGSGVSAKNSDMAATGGTGNSAVDRDMAAAGRTGVSAVDPKTPAAGKRHTETRTASEDFVVHAVKMPKQDAGERFAEESKTSLTTHPPVGAYLFTPGLEGQRVAGGVQGAALKTNKNLVSLNTLSRVKRPWEAGFAAGGGIDRLNQLEAAGQAVNASTTYGPAPSYYSLSRVPGKNTVSDVRPGASFYAGIYLQKAVSDRWAFHTGLALHYYSTQVSVGQQVSVLASPSASLLNLTALAAAPAPLVYTVGDQQSYTNRYYMLELPVSMQFRINRSKLLPLFLEGGGSISRMMGANAIFYNPSTGLYLKNESVVKKTQIDVTSALLVGLPFHGIRIQAGPEVQYGLTPLVNVQGLGDQHFFYTGIRLVVLPGKR